MPPQVIQHGKMEDYRKIAEDFARHLKAKYGGRIERVILFGSVARGDYREESDVDLLVVTAGDWLALQQEIAREAVDWLLRTGVCLSAKVFSVEEFAKVQETGLGRNVALEGIPLA